MLHFRPGPAQRMFFSRVLADIGPHSAGGWTFFSALINYFFDKTYTLSPTPNLFFRSSVNQSHRSTFLFRRIESVKGRIFRRISQSIEEQTTKEGRRKKEARINSDIRLVSSLLSDSSVLPSKSLTSSGFEKSLNNRSDRWFFEIRVAMQVRTLV